MIKGLIFDFDGTILDTEFPEYFTWQEIFRSYNATLNLHEWAESLGTTNDGFDPIKFLEERADRPFEPEKIKIAREQRSLGMIYQQSIMPGIEEYLISAKQSGLKIAIASSSNFEWVFNHLERLELTSYFDAIITSEDVKQVKPAPDLFLCALKTLGILAGEAIVLEDSPNGITAAQGAGIFCVAIPNEISRHLDLSKADLIVNSLSNVSLDQLLSRFNEF